MHLNQIHDLAASLTSPKSTNPGVNFINVLQAAFTLAGPKSAKKTVMSSSFFAPLGSACVKAACRMLMKLTPTRQSNPKGVW